ncbi:Dph6-related ATP pyrophosphatase [Pedobacter sp. NJ-S-72]
MARTTINAGIRNADGERSSRLHRQGFTHAAFGDIFLEDLRKYREEQLSALHIKSVFPLWKRDTKELLTEFIDLGFKSILVCIKADLLDPEFAGRIIDSDFIKDLPPNVDICGENGEFHTFCFDGPIFKNPILFEVGERVYREYQSPKTDTDSCSAGPVKNNSGFWFCDLLPLNNS